MGVILEIWFLEHFCQGSSIILAFLDIVFTASSLNRSEISTEFNMFVLGVGQSSMLGVNSAAHNLNLDRDEE